MQRDSCALKPTLLTLPTRLACIYYLQSVKTEVMRGDLYCLGDLYVRYVRSTQ